MCVCVYALDLILRIMFDVLILTKESILFIVDKQNGRSCEKKRERKQK